MDNETIQQRINELNKMISDAETKLSDFINGITGTSYGASYDEVFKWEKERNKLLDSNNK